MNSAGTLHWSHAALGRINEKDFSASSALAARAAELGQRLRTEISEGRLPFFSMPYAPLLKEKLEAVTPRLRTFEHMVVLGIGGSALGARALQKAFFPQQDRPGHGGPWLWIADNVDAASLEAWLAALPAEKTVVVVNSKSGGTIETLAQYFLLKEWLQKSLGDGWNRHLFMVTDQNKGFLRQEVNAFGLDSLPVPDYLGGRYSVLSAVGLVPAAFLGMDWKALLDGAASVMAPLAADAPATLAAHPAFRLAVWNAALMDAGYGELIFFNYIPHWSLFGAWFAQLWAESLGKGHKGSMPIPAVGVTDQHSLQQMFLDGPRDKGCLFLSCPGLGTGRAFGDTLPQGWEFLSGKRFGDLLAAEGLGTRMAMAGSQVPLVHLEFARADEFAAGAMMSLLGAATIFTGWLLDIDPLDQPAVEQGKRLANARLGAPGLADERERLAAFLAQSGEVQEF